MSRLVVLLAALLAAVAPATALAVEPDGALVRSAADGNQTYRIVGGAPLRISSCAYTNNCAGRKDVPNLSGYRQYPRDGAIVNGLSDTGTYRFAGGAPLWISSCGYAPTCAGRIQVDDASFKDTAHVRAMPANGTVVRNVNDGGFYRFAGGAPLLVRCDIGAGCTAPTMIDGQTMARLGTYTPSVPRMRQYPANGTVVVNADDNTHFRFAGNSPLPIAPVAGAQVIDARTLVQNGTATPALPHIQPAPVDGTLLSAGGTFYRIAGGAAFALVSCAPLNNCAGAVTVDPGTIASYGGGRIRAVARDGTVLRGLPSNRRWELVGGVRRETFVNVAGITVDDATIERIPLPAGPPPPPPAPPPAFAPVISSGYKVSRRHTRFTSLKVRGAPPGAIVTLTCKGPGCPFKRAKHYRVAGGSLSVSARLRTARLRGRALVTVRVSAPTGARKQMTFKIRTRKLPVRTTRCAPPGGKLGRC